MNKRDVWDVGLAVVFIICCAVAGLIAYDLYLRGQATSRERWNNEEALDKFAHFYPLQKGIAHSPSVIIQEDSFVQFLLKQEELNATIFLEVKYSSWDRTHVAHLFVFDEQYAVAWRYRWGELPLSGSKYVEGEK